MKIEPNASLAFPASLEGRSTQFMHPAAQLPKRLLVDWPNCVSVVEFELCDHAYPAIDPFDVAGDGRRHSPASRDPVGARCGQTPAIGAECEPMDRAPMMQMWADRKASVGAPEPNGSVVAARRDNRAIRIEGNAVDLSLVRERLADRLTGIGIP